MLSQPELRTVASRQVDHWDRPRCALYCLRSPRELSDRSRSLSDYDPEGH